MAHRVVNEANMRAPAGLAAVDRVEFDVAFMRRPERAEVVIEISKRGKLFAQLAGAHVAVVIDDGGGFAGRARERPGSGVLESLRVECGSEW